MNLISTTACVLLLGISVSFSNAQRGTVDRDEYFRRMEQRALELSKKMADLTGTEQVQVIKPRPQEPISLQRPYTPAKPVAIPQDSTPQPINPTIEQASPQASFDALPGPNKQDEGNQTAEQHQYLDQVDDVSIVVQLTTEELKGSYFLRPFTVLQAPFDPEVKGVGTLDGKVGSGVGVVVGRRIENWTMSARFGYANQEFSSSKFAGFDAAGDVESLSLTGNLGLTIPLSNKLSFEASFGLGYATVSHSLGIPVINSLDVLSDSGFTYELSMLLDYSFSERMGAFLGYRLAGIPENDGSAMVGFDSVNAHLFELGLGLNF